MARKHYPTKWPDHSVFTRLCDEHGVTPYYVSRVTGIPDSSFSEWKRGRYYPKEDKLKKLSIFFGVPMNIFQDGIEEDSCEEVISEEYIRRIVRAEMRDIVRDEVKKVLKEVFK